MKHKLITLVLLLLILSCGSAKKVQETEKPDVESSTSMEKKTGLEVVQDKQEVETEIEAPIQDKVPEEETMKKDSSQIVLKEKHRTLKSPPLKTEIIRIIFDHRPFDKILQKHVSEKGNVNYQGIKSEWNNLRSYITSLSDYMPTDEWSKEEKLAYWINAYNAMTIDLILRNYPVSSIKDIKDPWKQRFWQLGDKWYNLDEIEHQIIRKMGEPRIHFALVCAAVSCPKLYNEAFTKDNLEDALTQLTKEFLADTSKNSITPNEIRISKIFSWFTKDFKQDGSLIDFLNKYSDVTIASNAKKRFNEYNWDLND